MAVRSVKTKVQMAALQALTWLVATGLASAAWAQGAVSFPYAYSGRITDASGAPKSGNADMIASFWSAETGGTQLGQLFEFASVTITQGVFTLSFSMTPSQIDTIFGDGNEPVYIQIAAGSTIYPRQRFSFIPLAMRVPVDNKTLAFDTGTGQLGIKSAKSAANGTVLTSDGNGGVRWVAANLSGTTASNVSITTGAGLTGGPITTTGTISLANTTVTAGSYTRANITVDGQGRITAAQSSDAIADTDIAAGANIAQSKIAGLIASLASREGTIATGGVGDYFRGDKTWQTLNTATVPESGTALYYSDVRVRASLSGTAPLSYSIMTGAISMVPANASTSGYLSSTDWGAFNAKQNALGFAPLNKAGDTMSGALSMGSQKIVNLATPTNAADAATKAYADGQLGGKMLDVGTPSNGQVVKWDQTNQKFYLDADQVGVTGGGIATINNLSAASQSIATSTSGSVLGVNSAGSTHTINVPMASVSGVAGGLVSNTDYQNFAGKVSNVNSGTGIAVSSASGTATVSLTAAGTAGTYAKVTTDAYGRVAAGSTLTASDIPPISASSITSGAIAVANGGTGATTLAANHVLIGNGTSAVQTVAPGASGNVLTSTGSGWQSTALPITVTSVTGTAPLSVATGTTTPVISMSQANATTNGYLGSTDWNTFNSKQAAGNYVTTLTGDLTTSAFTNGSVTATLANVATPGTSTKVSYDAKGRVTTGTTLSASDIPPLSAATISTGALAVANGGTGLTTAPTNGQIPIGNGTGYTLGTLTAGTGISVSNSAGAITVSATADASTKVSKSGDTMTGALTLPSNGLVAGTNQLVLTGGNVGIGTTAPSTLLELGSSSVRGTLNINGSSSNVPYLNLSDQRTNGSTFSLYSGSSAAGSFNIFDQNASAYRFTINSSGNVGIGTTAPSYSLDVNGTIRTGTTSAGGSPGAISVWPSDGVHSVFWIDNPGSNYLRFSNGGAPGSYPMVLTNNGNVGIGTTSPGAGLDVYGGVVVNASGANTARISFNATNSYIASAKNAAGIGVDALNIFGGSGTGLSVNYYGNIGIGTTFAADKLDIYALGNYASIENAGHPLQIATGSTSSDYALFMGADKTNGLSYIQSVNINTNKKPLALNPQGGNVGIGTTAPTNRLEVAGAIKSTTGGFVFPDGTVQSTSAASATNNSMISGWPDILLCTISDPNWGVFLFLPSHMPYVGNGLYYYRANSQDGIGHSIKFNSNGTFHSYDSLTTTNCADSISNLYTNNKAFNIVKGPAGQWLQAGNNAYYNAGNVGIGTTAPAATLDVVGSAQVSGSLSVGWERIITYGDGVNTARQANCSAGKQILGGGCYCQNPSSSILQNYPNSSTSWYCSCNSAQANGQAAAFAICARVN